MPVDKVELQSAYNKLTKQNLELLKEINKWREQCQKLEKMASRVPDDASICACGDYKPISSTCHQSGEICINCGGYNANL